MSLSLILPGLAVFRDIAATGENRHGRGVFNMILHDFQMIGEPFVVRIQKSNVMTSGLDIPRFRAA